jgi:hypothetical protein
MTSPYIQPDTTRGAAAYYYARKNRLVRLSHEKTAATGILTLTANPSDGETVVIFGRTYTFQDVLTEANGNVLIGVDASASLDNLIAAIGGLAGSGTLYAAATIPHAFVLASPGAGDTMNVRAKVRGDGGNSIDTDQTLSNGSWAHATLTGGVSP